MPTYTATGLVLHRLNLGETDKILTLYTHERGKISAVAKGARRATSRLSGATELFTLSRFLLATGKSKARCIERLVNGPLTPKMPASFLQLHRDVELVLDQAAASELSPAECDRR